MNVLLKVKKSVVFCALMACFSLVDGYAVENYENDSVIGRGGEGGYRGPEGEYRAPYEGEDYYRHDQNYYNEDVNEAERGNAYERGLNQGSSENSGGGVYVMPDDVDNGPYPQQNNFPPPQQYNYPPQPQNNYPR